MYIYILYFHMQKPMSKVWGGPLKKTWEMSGWSCLSYSIWANQIKKTTTTWNVVCMHGWRTYCILIVLFWKNCSYRSVDANIYSFCQCLQVCSCFSHFFPSDWTPHTTVSPQMTLEEKKKINQNAAFEMDPWKSGVEISEASCHQINRFFFFSKPWLFSLMVPWGTNMVTLKHLK